MPQIMKVCKLSDIAEVQTGPFGSQLHSEDYVEEGTPIVTVEHLGNRRFTIQNLPFVSNEDRERLSKYSLREGDIVFSRVGAVDRCSYVTSDENGWLFSGRCLRVRCHHECDALYLYYYFCSNSVKEYVRSKAVGATMLSLNTDLMLEIPIQFPQIKLQKEIAKTLSFLDSKIELNRQINDNLEAMAKQLYDYWFVQFDFPNEEGKPYKSSGGAMVWNEKLKREIPKGWSGVSLKDLAVTSRNAITPVENEVYQHFSIPSFDACGSYSLDNGSDIKSDKFVLQEGQLLVSKLNPWFNRVVWVPRGTNMIGSTEFVVLNPNNKSESGYIYSVIKSPKFVAYCSQAATGTSHSQRRVSPDVLMAFKVAYEPGVVQKYGCFMENIQKRQAELLSETATLTKQRNEFLPLLMNGQISIQ